MTVDWTLIGNWIVQGLIFAGFAFLGVYVGLKLFSRAATAPAAARPAAGRAPVAPRLAAAPALPPSPLAAAGAEETPAVRHAFEFEADRLTIILEAPVTLLADDQGLVSAWVDVVGWARLAYLGRGGEETPASGLSSAAAVSAHLHRGEIDEPVMMQAQLDQVLQRLHLSAERRRYLRALLEQNLLPAAEES